VSFPTRFNAKGLPDGKCWARSCMWPGEDKGIYNIGSGYTQYHDRARPVCSQNHLHGCPSLLPEPDPENARCCYRPSYKRRGDAPVRWRECSTCGAQAPRHIANELNKLETRPGIACRHENKEMRLPLDNWWQCYDCLKLTGEPSVWDHYPEAFEPPNKTMEESREEFRRKMAQGRKQPVTSSSQ